MFKCCSFCYLVIGPCCFFMVVVCSLLPLVFFTIVLHVLLLVICYLWLLFVVVVHILQVFINEILGTSTTSYLFFLSSLLFVMFFLFSVGISSLLPLCKLQVQMLHYVFVLGYNLLTFNLKKLYVFQNIIFLFFQFQFCLCCFFVVLQVL